MLHKVTVLLIMAAVVLSIAACGGGSKIKTEDQAIAYVQNYLAGKSSSDPFFRNLNCFQVLSEGNKGEWYAHENVYKKGYWHVTTVWDIGDRRYPIMNEHEWTINCDGKIGIGFMGDLHMSGCY